METHDGDREIGRIENAMTVVLSTVASNTSRPDVVGIFNQQDHPEIHKAISGMIIVMGRRTNRVHLFRTLGDVMTFCRFAPEPQVFMPAPRSGMTLDDLEMTAA